MSVNQLTGLLSPHSSIMPLNRVFGLWVIILYLTSEFSCSEGKPYRNNKEKFINLAVSTDYVYIGGETSLIQLNSSLKLIKKKDMENKNWLLAVYNNTMLLICNYRSGDQTECFQSSIGLNLGDPIGKVVLDLKIKQPSVKYVRATFKGEDILMIASSMCLSHDTTDDCRAISSYTFKDGPFVEFKPVPQGQFQYNVKYLKSTQTVNFKALFKIDKFVYFLFTTMEHEEGLSKLGKICTSSFRTNSYEDTPIICLHNGQNYTVAQDVVHWKDYNGKSWIFVAFSDISSSVICRYELTDVKATFMESRKQRLKCPYKDLTNSYFIKQELGKFCFNEEIGICQSESRNESCPEITHDGDGFCNATFFGSVEGSLPITSNDVIFTSKDQTSVTGAVVKLGIVPYYTHAIIYAGTSDGMLGQIFVTGTKQKVLDKFKKVQKSSPVLDIKVQNENVYVMTQNMVVNVAEKIKPCPHNVSNCEDCMELRNPVCGWNIVFKRCEQNPGTATWWLPSLGGQCLKLKVEDIFKEDSTVGMKESINVTFSFDPAIAFYYLNCHNANGKTEAYNLSTGSYRCLLEVTDEQFQLNVTYAPRLSDRYILIASTTVQPTKCSTLNRCSKCLDNNRCFWCLSDASCVSSTSSCPTNTRYLNHTVADHCPKINVTKVIIHKYENDWPTENLIIPVKHFDTLVSDENKLKCVVIDEDYDDDDDDDDGGCKDNNCVEYSASTQHPFTDVKCLNVETPKSNKKLHVFIKYNGSKVEHSADLEVYECKKFKDCGTCMYRIGKNYQCKWCTTGNGKCSRVKELCDTGGCTSNKVELKVDPNSGPENGGTTITISGFDFGSREDTTTVVVNGVACTEAMVTNPYVVECKTGKRSSSTSKDIIVTISNVPVTASNLFTYKKPLQLLGFRPQKSIQAGGKKITIVGENIGFSGSGYNISFCNVLRTTCVSCRYIKVRTVNANRTMCKMGKADNDRLKLTNLYVTIDDNTKLNFTAEIFQFVPNPKIIPIQPESGKVFKSGGSKITIQGSGFEDVGEVRMENVDDPCSKETESIVCKTPPFVKSDFDRRKRATGQNVVIRFDDYSHVSTIYFVEDPTFSPWSNVIEYEEGEKGAPIVIEGTNLLDGAKQEDYVVNIGLDGKCFIEEMTDWNITCLPPKNKPRTNHSDENIAFVIVQVARIQVNLGYIKYITALPILPMVIGILGGLLVVAVVLGSALVCVSRRKRKTAEKNFQMELVNMEDKIRETSREEFADAQMTIRDIKSDLVTSRVPYCNYQSYAFHQLFPNQDMDTHPILFEPMVTDDNRRKVQKAMDMFDKLMTNKLFMKSLVQTLESQNKLTPQDKAMFASLLSVCLIGNMKLFYQLINSLLIDMIKSATKKQQKVLFRRFESITQRLVVHWLALSLFDHLKKNGGMQLFMLYKATQTVIEKAPIDAVTILCKNTLAEERLLKNRVEHEILTLDIDLNGNSDQRIPVIVLDCDTITQVKKKCCTAIYKNQPASEIPTPDELELEWHAGKSGKLTLQDIDNISDRSNGMIRLNTLKHYMVKNGSVMALMYKESSGPDDDIYENQHVQGMVPTSTDHVKLLMPETAADNQDLKWHLSNLPDEEKSNKEHEIGEIFLNRLFHTKLILRDYIEACFEGITDSQSLSIPVRYFLCMIDKQGKEVGVDGDILQSWKSECYATRVWASLIAKPQILFDVNVPSHVEPCMDILKQVFIDSFTQCPQHVTKDASTQKLLFCKDIPEYRKNVNSFFIKVEAVNDQEFWKAMDEISSEQTKEMKFSRQATLHQLYKFIAKYKDEIIEDFQEKDETKDLAFGNKLEEVIDLMEEP